ncbi:MAG TPA: hypothetical protein VK431_01845 [Nitrosopumilaceae archaeon]|nr:hypothetical protein [Nitrosopumilaceae archaeon]
MSDDLINSIKQLILIGKGDPGRLEYILEMLTKDRILPLSDQKYLENIIPLYLGEKDPESIQRKNEYTIVNLQKEVQNLNERLIKLEQKGFEKYVGKKTIFLFVTIFVGWNVLQPYIATFLNFIFPSNLVQKFFPLSLLANYINYPVLQFVFVAMMFAWVFIGMIHLAGFIRSRKR